jgi:pyridoxal phosphate enzyme (YggS family)
MTDSRNMGLSERFTNIHERINRAAQRSGRRPDEIRLIAITKSHPGSVIRDALAVGATDFGENRVQEAEPKIIEAGRTSARWHLVGHLQANKVRRAVKLFDVIHSLDSGELAERLDRLCLEEKREEIEALIQVDLGHEITKSGADESEIPQLAERVNALSHVRLIGLMTLPPFFEDPEGARPFFRKLRELRNELARAGAFRENPGELSMGMTHDFEIAIEEGATMVRIGTALFGSRA